MQIRSSVHPYDYTDIRKSQDRQVGCSRSWTLPAVIKATDPYIQVGRGPPFQSPGNVPSGDVLGLARLCSLSHQRGPGIHVALILSHPLPRFPASFLTSPLPPPPPPLYPPSALIG